MLDEPLENWLAREVLRLSTVCIQRGRPDLFNDMMRVHAEIRRDREGCNHPESELAQAAGVCH